MSDLDWCVCGKATQGSLYCSSTCRDSDTCTTAILSAGLDTTSPNLLPSRSSTSHIDPLSLPTISRRYEIPSAPNSPPFPPSATASPDVFRPRSLSRASFSLTQPPAFSLDDCYAALAFSGRKTSRGQVPAAPLPSATLSSSSLSAHVVHESK
ncbi:hypothetical protein HDU76_010347 [Blyttiomyces sp. JEL0837]|nr:hypothetical protein HDU76_010347 [Blyttiomyces sp. JEL0837]